MKILFVTPRFHTNLNTWIKSLIDHKHKIFVHAINKGYIENYIYAKPTVFKLSIISKLLIRF